VRPEKQTRFFARRIPPLMKEHFLVKQRIAALLCELPHHIGKFDCAHAVNIGNEQRKVAIERRACGGSDGLAALKSVQRCCPRSGGLPTSFDSSSVHLA
jgi:hypothetical protein